PGLTRYHAGPGRADARPPARLLPSLARARPSPERHHQDLPEREHRILPTHVHTAWPLTTARRLAIAGTLPHTVVCHGARKTPRRYPRRFAEEFAASGLEVADLAAFVAAWRARVTAPAK